MTEKLHDLIIEQSQIIERIKKYKSLIHSKSFLFSEDEITQSLIEVQLSTMESYYWAITSRISYLKGIETENI